MAIKPAIPSPPAIVLPDGDVVLPLIQDLERLQGFPIDWTEPAVQSQDGRLRWTLVGNAVSVPVSQWLGRRLSSVSGEYDSCGDTPPSSPW
jgi:DNA (cytosine-5)-methyltransferase 1